MASNSQPQPPPPPPPPPPPQQPPPLPGAGAAVGSGAAEPELVSMIVNHLKSQGLFDQFRRDCLADVDTKPAYQNLRQRVDNFVSNHLATHTWSPHLNKNQLRNNIRQQVLKSGMLESGIDRIISQVVDPKINHTFRPQVEKAVHEFLATLNHKEEAGSNTAPSEEKADASVTVQGVSATAPSGNVASDAMSILETITSLNQEASAARASTENSTAKNNDKVTKRLSSQQSVDGSTDRERNAEDLPDREKAICDPSGEGAETFAKCEDSNELPCQSEEIKNSAKDTNNLTFTSKDTSKEIQQEGEDQKSKLLDKCDKKPDSSERRKEKKEKLDKKSDHSKKSDDTVRSKEEKQARESEPMKQLVTEKNSNKHKTTESTKESKEENTSVDSDMDVLSDITVSSVHTSDLSSFEEESEEETVISDSTEEGEITSDDEEEKHSQSKTKPHANELGDGKAKPVRHAYVRKPFLYSKYFSDSDDERTVEQRRQSIAKEKEERLLRRQINRERLEEKRKQKAAEKTKSLKTGNQNAKGKSGLNIEEPSSGSLESKATGTSIKDVLKEQKFLEKKVALSRKRKRDSRHAEDGCKKKYEPSEEDSKDMQKTNETCEKNSSKELKHNHGKSEISKQLRRLSESVHSTEESKSDSKAEKEHKRKTSTSLQVEGAQQESETRDPKRQLDRAEVNTEELQRQKSIFKNEKHPKKDSDTEVQHMRNAAKKESKSYRDKNEKEKTTLEDKLSLKHKYKGDGVHKSSEDVELHSFERSLKGEDGGQKHNQQMKVSSDDKSERKSKHRSERKISVTGKDGKNISESALKAEELLRKENKKDRHLSTEKSRAEYKSKRSLSDSRPQKDSLSASKQLASASHRRSESYSEDKHEIESTNSDCNLKQEDGVHKDRRRSKSLAEDKILLKSKSKSHSKQFKASETELQENLTKESGQKLDKDKSMEENDSDKQHKSKNEDKVFDESGAEFELVSGTQSTQGSQKDFSHRGKLHSGEKGSVKEKYRGDKDLGNSKLERRFSAEGHKSRNLKHSNKEIKKKEETIKLEDKDIKEMDSGQEKVLSITVAMDKKQSKKIACENRKGSISNQDLLGEEKQSASTTESSHAPASQKSSMNNDDFLSGHKEELMELDLKQTKVQEASNIEGKNFQNSLQATDAKYAAKEKISLSLSNKELKHNLADAKACELQFLPAAEKPVKQEDIPNKQVGALDTLSKQDSMDQEPNKQGAYKMSVVYETSGRILLNVPSKDQPSEDSKRPKNLKTVINSNSDDVPVAINSSREDAADAKSMDMDISDVTDSLHSMSKECHNSDRTSLFEDTFILKNDAAQVVYMEQHLSVMKDDGDNTTVTNSIEKDNEVHRPDEQAMGDSTAGLLSQADSDEAAKLESTQGSELKIKEEDLMTDITEDCGDVTTKELLLKRRERECSNTDPSMKGEKSTMMDNVEKNKVHDIDDMIQSSSVLVPERVPEETIKDCVTASEQEGNTVIGREDKNESNAVGTSAGSSKLSLLYSSLQTTPATVIGTSTEKITESTVTATSTGEEGPEGASHSEKDSDATTTCSEEESEVTVICTSIEADEGFTTGIWVKSSEGSSFITGADIGECTVAAAEEGGGSVVTEGLAESESFLTSTEEENGDCTMVDAEESGKDSVNASGVEIEDSVNSAGAEEKDDAVTSAGSEEKRKTSTCVDTGKFESSVSCLGEVESDGAVTSAGTETGEGSTSGDSSGEFRVSVRAGQVKEHEGTVTCTGAEERGHNFIICSVTGTDAQGESTVTGACIAMVTNNSATTGTSGDKSEDTVNGESAVTSTGITPEDDAEISVVCTGLEDSNEGFAVCLEAEKYESLMDSTRAKEEASITTVSVGPCDDEGFVTSTGSKEEDEEGEGIVTSTGRGNEENEHASTCTGMENENALICIGAEEGESSIICIVAEQMEAESGVAGTNINKLTVDSMTSAEKEANCGTNCKNDKGIVESSVTSASAADEGALTAHIGKHESTLIPLDAEECEGPMTSAMAAQDKSQSGTEDERENAMTSFDSRELDASISSAVPKEDENSLTPAGREEKVKGDIISTSTVEESDAPLHSAMDAEEGPLAVARADESGESSMILVDTEDTEVPMPSTATEFKECVHTFGSKQEKDECTMISTSIVEEFEAPMSSAAVEYDGQLPSMKTEEINENAMVSIDMEIYEVPMPSESSAGGDDNNDDDESHPTASGKEEKDECAMISTSVVEEQVILMSGEVTEEAIQHVSDTESKNETVMISTSTAECFEAPMSSVAMQDENKLDASETEGRYEAAMITTSMTEECEIVLISAAPQAESQLIVAEGDEDAIISPNASEECKIVETTATVDEQFELAAFNADAKSKGSVIFVGECGAPVLRVATNSEDQHAASSIGDKEEGAVITLSTMEECDSLFTFTVIEESQLAAESTEVKDKSEEMFNTANQIECILSTTGPEKSSNSLLVIGRDKTHESDVRGESAASQTTVDSEITETDENAVNLLSVDEALCVEISTETALSPGPSSEASEDDQQAEGVLHEDVTSELSCMISEASVESETLRNVNYKFNSNLLLESDFSEIRTPLPRAQALSLVSANEVTVNTNPGEVTIEAELGEKSDFPVLHVEDLYSGDDKTNLVKIDDIGIEVTFPKSNATFNSGNNAALPKLAEELEFESNLRTDESQQPESPRSEEEYADVHTKEFQKDVLQQNIALERETFHVENSETQTTEEHRSRGIQCKSSGAMDKEKCNQLIAQDVRIDDEQSHCSKAKPDNIKEVIAGDTAEMPEEIDVKHTSPKSTMEEKDEFTIEQDMSEKEKHGPESNENSPEGNQPVIVKRKRGRPRKYPLETVQPGGGESKADMSTGNLQFPIFVSRGKTPQIGTDISNKKETTNEDEAEKAEMIVRKRGRKPRRSLLQSEETETLEPERKRRKLTSSEDELKEQEEGEEEDDEEDDEAHSGATTRSATRLEAQRKQPSKPTTRATSKGSSPSSVSPRKRQNLAMKKRSPSDTKINKSPPLTQLKMQSTKRKREDSPTTVVRRKAQQKTEETPVKKAKR
ncbi:biorientation of chromosomes in cell division protein 1-like 1 isoform X1 [Grus americana]|uniref:biorientation of chromosomes in cell division protein 1-like 1 isoform X1 n=1 Tax=Grus americana TaxID=9117 RepID=UPI0024080BFD|nr:biorientation of chromosomes in cell division protein 1-like 1 isoform X1 [Grus americana]